MRESNPKLKPWQAIPAPPPRKNSVLSTEIQTPHSQERSSQPEEDALPSISEYTPQQIEKIKVGILSGRQAMGERGSHAFVFADAFAKAGGIQVPGFSKISADHLRVLGSIVLMWIEGPDYRLLNNWLWINSAMVDTLHRELNRAHQMAGMFSAEHHPDAYGWRFMFGENAVNPDACRRLAQCDNYGLGPGIFPLDIPIIFQPVYDRSWLEIVYRDEI